MQGEVGFRNGDLVAKNISFDYTLEPQVAQPGVITADGQLLIGSIGTTPDIAMVAGNLTSPDASITIGYVHPDITLQVAGVGGAGTITGNVGGPVAQVGNNWNIKTNNTNVFFTSTGLGLVLDFGGLNLLIGSNGSITTGGANVSLGLTALQSAQNAGSNTAIGSAALQNVIGGSGCTAIGNRALVKFNYAVPGSTFVDNTAVGDNSLNNLLTGKFNTCLAAFSGQNYTTSESSNLLLGNDGVVGESNTIRVGSLVAGAGDRQQNRHFATGITGVTVAASAPVGVASTGQLSSLGFGTVNQILTSNGAGVSPSWQAFANGSLLPFTFASGLTTPVRIRTYYFQGAPLGGFSTVYNFQTRYIVPVSGNITRVFGSFTTGIVGTNEASPLYLFVNNVNVAMVIPSINFTVATYNFNNIILVTPVVAGDFISFVFSTPNWAVAPQQINANLTAVLTA